ncbi:M16 family metallopeptidase [Draconibacterium halophilum]|uniref:Insulinase family protein n=1 Tax=Draconibacterium halophilum TaxID=2706887 RepID=A0A6C0RII4_9BACT|nr:M16 family metallopeptidase [Draconibacterium halophilum]QIA08951.1 insulinase family protein [Draconibacterium halophilum]
MKKFVFTMLAFLVIAPILVSAQDMLKQAVPVDPAIRTGKLENGMTYFIRHNEEPKERVSFYMIQNVGALLENDNQNGLAHFLEHMAFNGTQHYPGKGFLDYLEKNGVAFGRNINAYTSFNETVYNLSDVPATREGLIDSCLLVLNDWSNYLLLSDEEIENERGVISEEWRTRRNAGFRMRNQWFPVVFEGSKWAERDVIGDLNIIKTFEPETLRSFYHDWYRTDLQAIAIVGDIDVDQVEAKVKDLFSKIPAVENPQPRPHFEIPEHDETKFVLATDEEATNSSISIYIKHKGVSRDDKNIGYLRDDYIATLFNQMSRERISELLQKGNPPFISGSVQISGFVRGYDAAFITATANPDKEDEGLKAIYTEAQRIVHHGFTDGELNRAKVNLLTSMESAYKQRDKISNDQYVSGITNYFLEGEPLTDAEFDWQFGQAIMQTITLADVNKLATDMIVDKNRAIVITGPDGGAKHLTEEEALAILDEVENSTIEPYEDTAEAASLIEGELPGADVVSTKQLDELDAVEWKLSNNATVVFKHADYEKDEVSLRAYSPGGNSLLDAEDLQAASMLPQFIGSFGVGEFDAIALRKVLTGKTAAVATSLGRLTEGFNGSSTPKDFEVMMQLLYLQFNNPRFDKEAYEALKTRYVAFLQNMANNPQKIMSDSLTLIATDYNERTKLMSASMFDEINFAQMEEVYNDRFKDAGDFTFFIVGNIEENVAKEMAVKYIGSLKDLPGEEKWIDHKIRIPSGTTEKKIDVPLQTEKGTVNILVRTELAYTPESNIKLDVLQGILRLRYTEEVREKEGGTYGVGVGSSSNQYPYERKTLQINFDTDPEKADHLKSIIFREIDKIVAEGPTQDDLDKVILNMKKERAQAKEHNSYWMNALYNKYYHGFNTDAEENFDAILEGLTTAQIQKFTKAFYSDADVVDVVFLPKKAE